MIIIYISQRAWRPSNHVQIINYDAGIVLIDLHQLNVKTLQTIQISDTEYGQPHVNEEQNPQNNNPQHPLS